MELFVFVISLLTLVCVTGVRQNTSEQKKKQAMFSIGIHLLTTVNTQTTIVCQVNQIPPNDSAGIWSNMFLVPRCKQTARAQSAALFPATRTRRETLRMPSHCAQLRLYAIAKL